jgi:hypothetical protein
VFRRVLVGRRVAAADVPALQAEPKVDPGRSDAQAVLATIGARCDVADLVEVFANRHEPSSQNSGTIFARMRLMIRKLPSGGYRLYSRKKDAKTGKRRNLGTFRSLAAAQRHERAVQFFKTK